jgi:hypothetical protein
LRINIFIRSILEFHSGRRSSAWDHNPGQIYNIILARYCDSHFHPHHDAEHIISVFKRGCEIMPTLDWIGKDAVKDLHQKVDFHLLRDNRDLSVGDPPSGILLVEGDNLLALKALLPYYACTGGVSAAEATSRSKEEDLVT